jgi:imidazolonepropionase-like amidohydrolase
MSNSNLVIHCVTKLEKKIVSGWLVLTSAICLGAGLATSAIAEEPAPVEQTIIHAGYLISVPGEPALENVSITIEGGVIKSISEGFVDGDDVVDLSDSYVLPGLIDMHSHVTLYIGVENNPLTVLTDAHIRDKAKLALSAIPLIEETLNAGFTTVRNLGDPGGVILDLRNAINQGIIKGPRIVAAMTQVSVSHGEYDPAHLGVRPEVEKTFNDSGLCDGPYECRKVVRKLAAEGVDVIKLRIAGNGEFFGHSLVYEYEDELVAVIETAHKLGLKVAAHVASGDASRMLLKAGVDTIEHGPIAEDAFKLARNAYFTPTLAAHKVVDPLAAQMGIEGFFDGAMVRAGEAYRAGVPILFGSDSAAVKHGEAATEFSYLVEAGLSPADALRSATVTAAEALGLEQQIGTVEVGKAADIVATAENPLENIKTLENITFVMKGGAVIR